MRILYFLWYRFDYDDKDFKAIVKILNEFLIANPNYSLPNMYPYVADVALFFLKVGNPPSLSPNGIYWFHTCQGHPGYFWESHWKSLGPPELYYWMISQW